MTRTRTLPGRSVALVLALLLFLLAGAGEASILHECAHHDMPAAGHAAAGHVAAGEAGAGPHQERHTGSADSPADDAPCTCIGTCHASAAAPVAVAGGPSLVAAAPPAAPAAPLVAAPILRSLFRLYPHVYPNPPPVRG